VQDGVGPYQLTQKNARRSSGATAYLRPAASRPNLKVVTGECSARRLGKAPRRRR
jgi:choline dehydrogenase-like flavoprotein